MRLLRILILALLYFTLEVAVCSGQITSASCSQSDVQNALNLVTNSTTTVTISSTGSPCHWTAGDSLVIPSGNSNLTIQGSSNVTGSDALGNPTGAVDATVIVDDFASNSALLQVTTAGATSKLRVTGITFQGGTSNTSTKYNGILSVGGNSLKVRIDHNHFNLSTYPVGQNIAIKSFGWIEGVTDHNLFDDNQGVSEGFDVEMDQYGGGSWGDKSWNTPTNFGTSDFMFLENNTFNEGAYIDDCSQGARKVSRFNTINQAKAQTHPTGSGPRFRGCRATETYRNNYTAPTSCNNGAGFNNCPGFMMWLSSGANLTWGNTSFNIPGQAYGGYNFVISIHSMRRLNQANNGSYNQTATPNGWGYCGTFLGPSNWDGNNDSTGNPCLDDPGQGAGDLLNGNFPNVCNQTQGCGTFNGQWPREAPEPVYEFLNAFTNVPNNPTAEYTVDAGSPPSLVANRDYYAYTTSFNGSSGTGSGTLLSRPTNCTTGVAYWATDQGSWNTSSLSGQGVLYKCTSTNTWTLYYTPYTYPHPLVSGPVPPPPSNVLLMTAQLAVTTTGKEGPQ